LPRSRQRGDFESGPAFDITVFYSLAYVARCETAGPFPEAAKLKSNGGRTMADGEQRYTTDEQTGKTFEIVPEKPWDRLWASVSFAYLGLALGFFLWLLFDTWIRKNTLLGWLGYASPDKMHDPFGAPIFRSFSYAFIGGALGGVIAGYRSCIFWHSEKQAFGARFVWRYLFFPWLGATLALFVYAILGSGVAIVGGNIRVGVTNMLMALAIGSLVGYGSPQVVKWLDSQVNKLFKVTTEIQVPDLTGLTQPTAEKILIGTGLKMGKISNKPQPGVVAGNIFEQDPLAGSSASTGDLVNVTIAA
jgi:hypothetical protein